MNVKCNIATVVAFSVVLAVVVPVHVHAAQTVLVMRHCARTTPNDVEGGAKGYDWANNYTAQPWPAWPDNLAPYLCLPNGLTIVKGTGTWLRLNGNLPQPIAITADNVTRDLQTSEALIEGLQWKGQYRTDHGPFSSACTKRPNAFRDSAIRAHLAAHPLTQQYTDALNMLQQVTGKGVAPLPSDIPNHVHHGYLEGGIEVGQGEAERLLMELGGNMTVGWGNVKSPIDVYTMLNVHSYARFLQDVIPAIQRNEGASITAAVLSSLSSSQPGTQFYVGHDSQLWSLAATLGLWWAAEPLPMLPTLPGSMLRFDKVGDTVTVSYLYALFTDSTGQLYTTPATVAGANNSSKLSLSQLQAIANAGINQTCVVKSVL